MNSMDALKRACGRVLLRDISRVRACRRTVKCGWRKVMHIRDESDASTCLVCGSGTISKGIVPNDGTAYVWDERGGRA
jgi:hypothetical protein